MCRAAPELEYGDVAGLGDIFNYDSSIERSETTDFASEVTMKTNLAKDNPEISRKLAGFLHRADNVNSPNGCEGRARLTPSGPTQTGAMWCVAYKIVNSYILGLTCTALPLLSLPFLS